MPRTLRLKCARKGCGKEQFFDADTMLKCMYKATQAGWTGIWVEKDTRCKRHKKPSIKRPE